MAAKVPCGCPCHVKAERDIHVSKLTGSVLWCCHAPFAQPAPLVEPTPMFEVTVIEVKPMEMPDIRCPNCKGRVIFSLDHKVFTYGLPERWLCQERSE